MLTVLAPPVESHDNPTGGAHLLPTLTTVNIVHPHGNHGIGLDDFFGGSWTATHPDHFEIHWIRIYKNPKTTPLKDLKVAGHDYKKGSTVTNRIIAPPNFIYRRARLFPSLWTDYEPLFDGTLTLDDEVEADYVWVDIEPGSGPSDPNSGGLIDTGENSGLVTATENTTVAPGDRVAIAINVKLTHYRAVKENGRMGDRPNNDLPLQDSDGNAYKPEKGNVWARDYHDDFLNKIAGGSVVAAVGIPGVGILNPNYPLELISGNADATWANVDTAVIHEDWNHENADGYHTIVYQFTVTEAHDSLNSLGEWLAGAGTIVAPFNVEYRPGAGTNYEFADFLVKGAAGRAYPGGRTYPYGYTYDQIQQLHDGEFGFVVPFGETYTAPGGKRWKDFLDPALFLAGAPYVAYPESTDADNDPELDAAAVASDSNGNIKRYLKGAGKKKLQYRHHADSFNSHESNYFNNNNLVSVADHGFTNFDGVYRRDENYPFYIERRHLDRNDDGILDYFPVIDTEVESAIANTKRSANGRVRHYSVSPAFYTADLPDRPRPKFPHRFPPTYDGHIDYPRVVTEFQPVTPEIVGAPTEKQTGDPFQVTLSFERSDENLTFRAVALDYDESDAFLASLQAALTAAFEHATVTQVERLEPRDTEDKSVRYQVTVVPSVLGFVGEMTLRVPENTVVDMASELGNAASAAVTVPIDTSLQLVSGQEVEVVEPEGNAYQSGDEIEVRVPFETDGLTYEGDNPPYVTIYLGAQEAANARHATWQKGAEQSGSTVVPFVYVLQDADPSAESVSVDLNSLSIPRETTLMSGSGLERAGTTDPAMAPGEAVRVSETRTEPVIFITDPSGEEISSPGPSGERPGTLTVDLPAPVKPPESEIYLPPVETDPKAVASTVPRSPIVFNELGNGSGDATDWLELRNVSGSDVSLKDWELSVVADGKKEDTSLIVFPDVSVPSNGLLLITNSASDKTPLAGGANKGLSHASLVDAGLSLPDDGKFLLILRNAKEKLGLDEAFIDVAGGGGSDTDAFIRDETGDYDTHVWPLQVLEAPGDATEDALSSGKVWQRAKADIIGYHRDAWAEAAFTGIGYDRKVSKSAATSGTPGYPNGAVKTEASTPKGAVTISEIMFDSEGGTLPQWIELYNKSKTEALNLNRWQLEIQNRNSPDLVGRPIVTLTLQEKVIQPNQTLLIVAGDARASSADVFPEDRVYNLLKLHEKNLRIKTPRDTFLSGEGFYLKLSDRNGTKIDEVGNIDDNRRTDDAPVWVWPTNLLGRARSSVVRRYDKGTAVARDGMVKSSWALAGNFNKFKVESLHYGHADDIGTPGYRKGGALPVELSSFTVSRTDAGPVVVTWTTESEVDNAGFNLRRSLKRDSGFTLLNPVLIAGAGTTGERQTYTFTDTSAKPGIEYYYQIEEVSLGGRPETLRTRRLPGPVSPANRSLTTFGEVKQRE